MFEVKTNPWKPLAALRLEQTVSSAATALPGDLTEARRWQAIVSGEASLTLENEPGSGAMRLDYDFKGGGGFVVARREVALALPRNYSIRLRWKGTGPANDLEWKWVDAQGSSVWRYVKPVAAWPEAWESLEIRGSDIGFAWGPAGGGPLGEAGAIELAIVARDGGAGVIWLTDIELVDQTNHEPPQFACSSERSGHPASAAGEPLADSAWESAPEDPAPVWSVDYGAATETSGVVMRWATGSGPAFALDVAGAGGEWEEVAKGEACGSRLSLIEWASRPVLALRLRFAGGPAALQSVELWPVEPGDVRERRFHLLASLAPRGWLPRYWLREQSYWTPMAPPVGEPRGLMNEEGLVEASAGFFSLEPFLYDEGKLITWAGVLLSQGQMDGWMPVPWASWEYGAWKLTITAAATGDGFGVRYRLENGSGEAKRIRLLLAIRPFQATPPWQAFRGYGGIGKVRTVTEEDVAAGFVPPPQPFGVGSESAGLLTEILAQGRIPNASAIEDPAELGCAVAGWDFALAAGESTEVRYGLPVEEAEGLWRAEPVAQAWRIEGGTGEAVELGLALRAATAHILVNREGPALHPGPRRYDRCWIRDSAGMARALLQAGCREPVRALLEWYAPYIREDGWVPCLVDRQGPDWLPEYDSQGQFAHIVAEYLRYGGERPVAERMWPVVLRTMDCLASLRERRMTPAYREGNPPHRYGLLPESASHEGYLAHPVHSYWDDFWALRGLRDAVWLAGELGDWERRASLAALHEHFASAVAVSLEGLIAERGLDFVPGSVEWADYDPSATANGLVLLEQLPGVREELLAKTFRRYLERFRARIAESVPWDNYSAYEIRIAGALILLGWRDEALEVLGFFLKDRRPAAWNQWPEISWHNMRAAGHLGDVPHTWISAEFISAARALLVAERHLDDRLILGAGIPLSWWSGPEGLTVRDWPAECGLVTFSLKLEAPGWARWRVEGDLRIPSGGVVLAAELPGRLKSCRVDDVAVSCDGLSLPVILHAPADVQFQFDTV